VVSSHVVHYHALQVSPEDAMSTLAPTLGDVPRLREDVHIGPFQESSGSTPRFIVQTGPSCFVVNSEMRDLLQALSEAPVTFPEFADKVTARTGQPVSVETLRTVLSRLSPSLFQGQAEYRIKTPFIFNIQIVSAGILRRITKLLTWLFTWPVAVLGLIAFFGMEYAIFHTRDYRMIPGQSYWFRFALIYLGVGLGGLIHEVGHLTACARYKAEHGGIGLGLYLIFPTFYADVTNAWRLPRSARVAVDLGGLYFQALFLVVVGILAVRTHNMAFYQLNFFTLVIMVFTLNPALKFDGYWLVVDASGIHNLYPRMSAMMKGIFRKKETVSGPVLSDDTKMFLALYAGLVFIFSSLLIVLVAVSTYRVAIAYPEKLSAASQALSKAIAVGSTTAVLKTIGSLAVDSFWFLIVATFVFDFTRKAVRLVSKT
jgi:putative peptide zinc metalloprotease protein